MTHVGTHVAPGNSDIVGVEAPTESVSRGGDESFRAGGAGVRVAEDAAARENFTVEMLQKQHEQLAELYKQNTEALLDGLFARMGSSE